MRFWGNSSLLILSLASRLGLVNVKRASLITTVSDTRGLAHVLILLEEGSARDAREALRRSIRMRRKPHPLTRLYWRVFSVDEVREGRLTHLEYTVYTPVTVTALSLEDEIEVYKALEEGVRRFHERLYELLRELLEHLDEESIQECLGEKHCIVDTIASMLEAYVATARVAGRQDTRVINELAGVLRDARKTGNLCRIREALNKLKEALSLHSPESLDREPHRPDKHTCG